MKLTEKGQSSSNPVADAAEQRRREQQARGSPRQTRRLTEQSNATASSSAYQMRSTNPFRNPEFITGPAASPHELGEYDEDYDYDNDDLPPAYEAEVTKTSQQEYDEAMNAFMGASAAKEKFGIPIPESVVIRLNNASTALDMSRKDGADSAPLADSTPRTKEKSKSLNSSDDINDRYEDILAEIRDSKGGFDNPPKHLLKELKKLQKLMESDSESEPEFVPKKSSKGKTRDADRASSSSDKKISKEQRMYNEAMELSEQHSSINIGSYTHLHPNTISGANSSIGSYSSFGADSIIGPNSRINSYATIGPRSIIGSGTQLNSYVTIGDNCIIGPGVNTNVPYLRLGQGLIFLGNQDGTQNSSRGKTRRTTSYGDYGSGSSFMSGFGSVGEALRGLGNISNTTISGGTFSSIGNMGISSSGLGRYISDNRGGFSPQHISGNFNSSNFIECQTLKYLSDFGSLQPGEKFRYGNFEVNGVRIRDVYGYCREDGSIDLDGFACDDRNENSSSSYR